MYNWGRVIFRFTPTQIKNALSQIENALSLAGKEVTCIRKK